VIAKRTGSGRQFPREVNEVSELACDRFTDPLIEVWRTQHVGKEEERCDVRVIVPVIYRSFTSRTPVAHEYI
jgi:hypothetical protein